MSLPRGSNSHWASGCAAIPRWPMSSRSKLPQATCSRSRARCTMIRSCASRCSSIWHNQRLRLRVWCDEIEDPLVDSLTGIWASADWFEREAFDLFGILFRGHPDLRRILTDYGFIGHPFRKDFPLIGNVEVHYDPQLKRVVYAPVSIEARTLVPRVIRHDNRYDPALHDLAGKSE